MIRETEAKELLSPETLAAGGTEYGWCYYEEDEAASVVIRELLDRGIPAAPSFVRCEYSETHAFFQENKIYSVAEFDRLMKQADDRRVAGREAAIKKYGTEQRWIESKDPEFDEFFGYDKVSFVIVLPDGVRVWGRQDVGAGYGGLLDYLRQNEKYRDIVPILQQATERERRRRCPRTSLTGPLPARGTPSPSGAETLPMRLTSPFLTRTGKPSRRLLAQQVSRPTTLWPRLTNPAI
nr:LPD25 domain-containing protein [Pseudoflavonifractor sp. 60]